MSEIRRKEEKVKKVYLFCSAGMSTSMLASKMQECADDRKLNMLIEALSISNMEETLANDLPDYILLGPQVKYRAEEIREKYKEYNRPIEVIDMMDYGFMDGESVLNKVLKKMNEKGKNNE